MMFKYEIGQSLINGSPSDLGSRGSEYTVGGRMIVERPSDNVMARYEQQGSRSSDWVEEDRLWTAEEWRRARIEKLTSEIIRLSNGGI